MHFGNKSCEKNVSYKPENNGLVVTQTSKVTASDTRLQRNSTETKHTHTHTTLLSVFTIHSLLVTRKPRHDLASFTAEICTRCQVDKQTSLHYAYTITQIHLLPSDHSQQWSILLFYTHAHKHPFNRPFYRTTQVSRYQKGKTNLDFTEARDSEWQWHQLGHMQVCTSLQTDNHTSTSPHFVRDYPGRPVPEETFTHSHPF